MSEIDATLVKNGQKVVATVSQSGTIISDPSAVDATALVQTDDGPQLCVKTFEMGEGGGGGGGSVTVDSALSPTSENPVQNKVITNALENVYTQDNLVAGANISITEVAQPLIDSNTLHLCHFNDSVADVISGQSDWPSTDLVYLTGKFDKARGFTNTSFKAATPQINFSQNTTVDFWLAPLTGSGNVADLAYINASSSSTGASFLKFYNPNGSNHKIQIGADFSGTGSNVDIQWTDTSFSWGNFFHVAFEKDVTNGAVYLFVNGKKVYEHAHTSAIGNVTLYGRTNGSSVDGTAFDEFRISNVVRWYTDFTPFSVPYSTTAGETQYQINNTKPDPDLSAYLQNQATGTNSLSLLKDTTARDCIAIGYNTSSSSYSVSVGSSAQTSSHGVSVGYNCSCIGTAANSFQGSIAIGSQISSNMGTAVGSGTKAVYGVAIGRGYDSSHLVEASLHRAIAIGVITGTTEAEQVKATAQDSIQLGAGTNSTAKTFQVFTFQLLDGTTGLIPAERIGTGYDATKTQVLKNVNGTLTWVDE